MTSSIVLSIKASLALILVIAANMKITDVLELKRQEYPPDTDIFRQGELATHAFFLETGGVKLSYLSPNGVEAILLLLLEPCPLGIGEILLRMPHPATARTLNTCLLYRVAAADFINHIHSSPSLSIEILYWQCRLLHECNMRISELVCLPTRTRLAHFISRLLDSEQTRSSRTVVRLPIKQYELAEYIGATSEYLNRLLSRMEREGVLSHRGRCFMAGSANFALSGPHDRPAALTVRPRKRGYE